MTNDQAQMTNSSLVISLLKRGIIGAFHHVSPEHLQRYCDEFDFRWDHRGVNDSTRRELALKQVEGKRLMFKMPI